MTEQTSALKSKDNNNAAGMQQSHGGPPMQKAAPGTTKRIFGYIFQYKWRVVAMVVCILVGRGRTSRFVTVPAIAGRYVHPADGRCHQP